MNLNTIGSLLLLTLTSLIAFPVLADPAVVGTIVPATATVAAPATATALEVIDAVKMAFGWEKVAGAWVLASLIITVLMYGVRYLNGMGLPFWVKVPRWIHAALPLALGAIAGVLVAVGSGDYALAIAVGLSGGQAIANHELIKRLFQKKES